MAGSAIILLQKQVVFRLNRPVFEWNMAIAEGLKRGVLKESVECCSV